MQGAKTAAQLDEPCDICGHVGYKDLIVTCSKCFTAREHAYCLRSLAIDVPEFWICDTCLSNNGIVSPQSGGEEWFLDPLVVASHNFMHPRTHGKACANSKWQDRSKTLTLETGKVKFLPAEEAIRLSSETLKMGSPRHNNPGLKYGPSSSIAPMSRRRTSIRHKIVTPNFSIPREKTNLHVISLEFAKPPTHDGAEISTMIGPHEVKTSKKESKEDCGGKQWPGNIYMSVKGDKIFKSKTKEVKTADANLENTMYRVSYVSTTSVPKGIERSKRKITKTKDNTSPLTALPISSSGETFHVAEPENFALEERDLLNISKLELYHRYCPALEDTWKGGFESFDTATLGKFYGLFQARPPCRVRRKVFEFSKRLPLMLQVKMLPRSHLWAELFGNDCPDFHDIALYFFPAADIERSKQNFSCLFELLEIQNLVMRSYIDGVELLIFTSKQLHVDCQRVVARSSTEYFLWGVFRHAKSHQILDYSLELPSLVSTVKCTCDDHASMDNVEAIDMDVDMEGGRIVGPVDIVVSKELSGRACGSHNKVDVNSAAEMVFKPWMGRSKPSDEIICKVTSEYPLEISKGKLVNARDDSAFPQGFKDIPMLKSRSIKEKAGVVDGVVIRLVRKENVDIHEESEAAFGAFSPQPERYSEDSNLTSQKHNREAARDLAYEPLTAFTPPFFVKRGLKIEDEGNDDENAHSTWDKKDLEADAKGKMNISVCWRPPPKNWVKLNIDGSSTGGLSSAGAGGIIRNESGRWLLGYSKNLGASEGLASELWSLYHGLDLVWKHGFRKVLVESASPETLKCLKQPIAFLDVNRGLIQCCKDLLNRNWDCKLQYIFPEANLCANWLATHCHRKPLGSLAVFDSPPHKLIPILQKDSTGIVQSPSCQSPKGFPDQLHS